MCRSTRYSPRCRLTFGSVYVNDFTLYGRNYQVNLQSEAEFRRDPSDLKHVFVRADSGSMIPLSALVTVKRVVGPDQLERFNAFNAAKVTGNPAPGYTSGDSIKAMQEVAAEVLPQGYQIAWTGSAYQGSLDERQWQSGYDLRFDHGVSDPRRPV